MTDEQQLIHDFHDVFTTEPGKRVLEHIKARTQHGKPAFVIGHEAWQAAYRNGAQSVTQLILDILDTPPNSDTSTKIIK
jgi:hypothetical protein